MKKNIYMVSSMFFPSIGGVENHIYFLSKQLVEKGYIVKIMHPVIGQNTYVNFMNGIEIHNICVGNENDRSKYERLKYKSNGSKLSFIYGYLRKNIYNKFKDDIYFYIENDIKKNNIEQFVIHQHDFISNIKLSKKLAKKYKVIFTNHTGEFLMLKKLPLSKFIIRYLTNHFSYIIAPSNELAAFQGIRNSDTYSFISNGVDLELFNEINNCNINDVKNNCKISCEKIIVLCPRRWAPTKGIIYLVKAIKLLKYKNINNVEFLFVGNEYNDYPEYKDEIEKIINECDLYTHIKMLGNVDSLKMSELLRCSDVVVLPSIMEAVSLSALEAMATNKVVIGTNVGGFPQIIKNGETGFLIPPADEEKLADKLADISTNFESYKNIGRNAGKFVKENYSWEMVCDNTIEIYEKYMNINK